MSRLFSTTARTLLQWAGFPEAQLAPEWVRALDTFSAGGASAEAKFGALERITIKSRNGNPVHKSHYNPSDKEDCISVAITGAKGKKTCHVYIDATGTTKIGDKRE